MGSYLYAAVHSGYRGHNDFCTIFYQWCSGWQKVMCLHRCAYWIALERREDAHAVFLHFYPHEVRTYGTCYSKIGDGAEGNTFLRQSPIIKAWKLRKEFGHLRCVKWHPENLAEPFLKLVRCEVLPFSTGWLNPRTQSHIHLHKENPICSYHTSPGSCLYHLQKIHFSCPWELKLSFWKVNVFVLRIKFSVRKVLCC